MGEMRAKCGVNNKKMAVSSPYFNRFLPSSEFHFHCATQHFWAELHHGHQPLPAREACDIVWLWLICTCIFIYQRPRCVIVCA